MGISVSCLFAEPWEDNQVGPYKSVKKHFFVCYSLVGLLDTSSIGFQSSVFWGSIPQVEVLKAVDLDVRYKFFTPQGEIVSCEFLSIVCCQAIGVIYGEIISLPLLPIFKYVFFCVCLRNV